MGKRNYDLDETSIKNHFPTPGKLRSRQYRLGVMIKRNYFKKKKMEIKIASQQKELGIVNKLLKE